MHKFSTFIDTKTTFDSRVPASVFLLPTEPSVDQRVLMAPFETSESYRIDFWKETLWSWTKREKE